MIGEPPDKKPFCVQTVTSNCEVFNSALEMTYSKVASNCGLQLSVNI